MNMKSFYKLVMLFSLFFGAINASIAIDALKSDAVNNPSICDTAVGSCVPKIEPMGLHEVQHGDVFQYQPEITKNPSICRKDMGHDDVMVDSETGAISWDTSSLEFGRGFHIRIKCSNYYGSAYASMVVHVDKSGSSRIRVAGEDGVSPYIGVAGSTMQGGDTIVFPDGLYPVSVTADESFENAFKNSVYQPVAGDADQFSTIIAQTPGRVIISGAPHNDIPKQKNAFQISSSDYFAVVGFVVKDIARESFTAKNGNHLLIDFLGTQGAGTSGNPCSNFVEAGLGWCSKAGMRVSGETPLIQNSYDWGHNRYGIMTRSTEASVTRRSFVRLDEHRGDQPYGGFSDYCDASHLSQDNTIFDSLAIAAPHYKNYAGLSAFPATGCENVPSTLKVSGLFSLNNELSLSLMDSKAGVDNEWEYIVSYDTEGTCTPQTNRCAAPLLQSDKPLNVNNSYFGKALPFLGGSSGPSSFGANINLETNVSLIDVHGESDQGQAPEYLPDSLLYFRGRSDTFYGDEGYDEPTQVRRWPVGGEDIIALNMREYYNPTALQVGGGTIEINGNRGAASEGETISEYMWSYTNPLIPPLVVRVKNKGTYHRIAWEHLTSFRKDSVTGWKVMCMSPIVTELAVLDVKQLVFEQTVGVCDAYAVKALYKEGESGLAYIEQPNSGDDNVSPNPPASPFPLEQYTNPSSFTELVDLPNLSGITYNWMANEYVTVHQNQYCRFDASFNQLFCGSLACSDCEDIQFMGSNGDFYEYALVEEGGLEGSVVIVQSPIDTHDLRLDQVETQLLTYANTIGGDSGEGVAFDAINGLFYVCIEDPEMQVLSFERPEHSNDASFADGSLVVTEVLSHEQLSAVLGSAADLSSCYFNQDTDRLWLMSHIAHNITDIDLNGEVFSQLDLPQRQVEGFTFNADFTELIVVAEPNVYQVYIISNADGGDDGDDGDDDGDDGDDNVPPVSPPPLQQYTNPSTFTELVDLPNLSGITYNWIANEYVTVHQNRYCRFDASFNQLFCGSLSCSDCEDIHFMGSNGDFYEYALVEEGGPEGSVVIVQSPISTHDLRLDQVETQLLTYANTIGGDSGEGVAFDEVNGLFYVCIEDPEMQVLSFERPEHSNDASFADGSLVVTEVLSHDQLSAVLGSNADLSSCYYNLDTGRLWIMSHIAHNITDIDLNGQVFSQLDLPQRQVEGFTFNADFSELIVVAEPNVYQVYSSSNGDGGGDGDNGGDDGDDNVAPIFPPPLQQYTNPSTFTELVDLPNLSGITYNWIADEYVTVHQNRYCRFDASFNQLFCGSLSCGDCEDIHFMGTNGDFYEYALVEEGGPEGSVVIVQSPISTHDLRLDKIETQLLTYANTIGGDSGEGIAFDEVNGTFYVCIEDPEMQVLSFERPGHSNDTSFADGSLVVSEVLSHDQLSAVLGSNADLSSCYYNLDTGRLWLMSHIAHNITDIDLNGLVYSQLDLSQRQVEGFTFNADFSELIIVAEPNVYQVYESSDQGASHNNVE